MGKPQTAAPWGLGTAQPIWPAPPGEAQPIAFSGCRGWLHPAQGALVRTAGVVIVNTVGRDGRSAYRPLRILAERLARAGFATLRYDQPGQGDSLDLPPHAE